MVEVRASRLAVEALGDEGLVGDVTRVDVGVAADFSGAQAVNVSRVVFEVLASEGTVGEVTRVDVQAGARFDSTETVLASRLIVEVLGGELLQAAATRLDVQAAAQFDATTEVRASRITVECLARQGSAGPVVPLALMDDASIFLHNWATKAELETSFRTSVSNAPSSGAESRRGLNVKPFRTLDLEWMVCDGLSLAKLERLEVFLRRMTDQRFQVPIYMDQQELGAAYGTLDTILAVDTSTGRFFPGARIGIAQIDAYGQVSSASFHTISSMTNAALTLSAALGIAVAQGSFVFPMLDCEIALEVQADYTTARVPIVRVSVAEAPGASQLPPLKSDFPTGASTYLDYPIWYEQPDWSRGVKKGRNRQGSNEGDGRADFVVTEATRSRQTHEFDISGTRQTMWNALEFFETRRGRLRTFWHIDQDQYYEVQEIDASGNFVGVREIGSLADTQEEFEYVGIVMNDGTHFVREAVSIQQILTVFRIAMDAPVTPGLSASNVARVARARITRFKSDSFREVWTHTGYMAASISLIEALDETNYPTT